MTRYLTLLAYGLLQCSAAWGQSCQSSGLNLSGECRGPEVLPWVWVAGGFVFTSGPQCNTLGSATGGQCETEGEAWAAHHANLAQQVAPYLCGAPGLAARSTDLMGNPLPSMAYYMGQLHQIKFGYDLTYSSSSHASPECIQSTSYTNSGGVRPIYCPIGYGQSGTMCLRYKPEACPAGNPIQCSSGEKIQQDVDFAATGLLEFSRNYSSSGFYYPSTSPAPVNPLGPKWRHNWEQQVVMETVNGQSIAHVVHPTGDYRHYLKTATGWQGRADQPEKLTEVVDAAGARTGWIFEDARNSVYLFNAAGRLLSLTSSSGEIATLTYSSTPNPTAPQSGLLIAVTDEKGRTISLIYGSAAKLAQVIDPNGNIYQFTYDRSRHLSGVTGPSGTRSYLYNETGLTDTTTYGALLTGIVDERGQRYLSNRYDGLGRAIEQWHGDALGANRLLLNYIVTPGFPYTTPRHTLMLDAAGQRIRRRFVNHGGIIRDAGTDRCLDAGCSTFSASTQIAYDTNGNVDSKTDFKGVVTDYTYNTRGLETHRIEAKNTASARITETEWHAHLNLAIERRVCSANVANTCPATALAPNLVSKTTYTYNSRGQLLTMTQIDPGNTSNTRSTSYSYCNTSTTSQCPLLGLKLSIDGPRTDVSDVTSYQYYPNDASDLSYRKGDLWKQTNAAGHVTEYLAYDGAGRALKIKDPNGVESWLSFHPRGWLASRTIKGAAARDDATTTFSYTAVGAIERVTQADGAYLHYHYDAARRLTGITDNAGNAINYTLDLAGNRIKETTTDGANVIKRLVARQYDQLSRMRALIRAPYAAATNLDDPAVKKSVMTYDANSNADLSIDPGIGAAAGTITDQDHDPLNRLIKTLQDVGGIAAKVEYSYDALDRLTQVTDPKLLNTVYGYDGLGNLSTLTSPDTGVTTYAYNAAGNRVSEIDARGAQAQMTHDVLDRVTHIQYTPAGSNVVNTAKTVQFYYDQTNASTGCLVSFPVGRLTRFTDESGSTTLCYDRRGNVIRKTQVTAGTTAVLAMSYNNADRLIGMTYPSGATVAYGRDGLGRITSVSVNGATLVSSISYYPFGPVQQIAFQNGTTLTRSVDQNYDIDAIVSSAAGGLNLDYAVDEVGNIVGVTQSGTPFALEHDKLYRLTAVNLVNAAPAQPTPIERFTYDKTGNRLSRTLGTAPALNYDYAATDHRLINAGTGTRSFDANGNTTQIPGTGILAYDERNRLATVIGAQSRTTAAYNARGERVMTTAIPTGGTGETRSVMKVVGGGCTGNGSASMFLYAESGALLGNYDLCTSSDEEMVYVDTMPIARIKDGVVSPIEADHLGTPRVMQKPDGSGTDWTWNLLANSSSGSNVFGEQAPTGKQIFNLRFPGQYADGNGLHYNYFRDYEAATGRYIESDPIGLQSGVSTFGYVGGRPTHFSDPEGLFYPQGSSPYRGYVVPPSPPRPPTSPQSCQSFFCFSVGLFEVCNPLGPEGPEGALTTPSIGAGFKRCCRKRCDDDRDPKNEVSIGVNKYIGYSATFDDGGLVDICVSAGPGISLPGVGYSRGL